MKNKKILIILIIVILAIISYIIYKNISISNIDEEMTEYIPEEEITEEQLRQTIVSLYFKNKDTNTLMPEARTIDVKELIKDPYNTLINLLIGGPKNEKLESVIPEGSKVNKIELKDNIINIDLSKEFVENHKGGAEEESITIYSIVNTLSQLNEVEGVKITIEGEENKSFKDNAISFSDAFVKKEE